jgi:hypothetical protein
MARQLGTFRTSFRFGRNPNDLRLIKRSTLSARSSGALILLKIKVASTGGHGTSRMCPGFGRYLTAGARLRVQCRKPEARASACAPEVLSPSSPAKRPLPSDRQRSSWFVSRAAKICLRSASSSTPRIFPGSSDALPPFEISAVGTRDLKSSSGTLSTGPVETITARSITFCNSRILPGQIL